MIRPDQWVTLRGIWCDSQGRGPMSPEEIVFEEAARTGILISMVFDLHNGMEYIALAKVSKQVDGRFTCEAVTPTKRRMMRAARGPERLPE